MKHYAKVENGVCTGTWVYQDTAPVPTGMIDVTSLDPRPGVGWLYDGQDWTAPDPTPVVRTVTGQEVFGFLTPSWQSIYDGIPTVHAWRWDHFKTLMIGYWDIEVPVTNPTLTGTLDGLAMLGLINQSAVDNFLGR